MAYDEEVQAKIRRVLEGKENPIPPVDKTISRLFYAAS
jgi:hypothetical protein